MHSASEREGVPEDLVRRVRGAVRPRTEGHGGEGSNVRRREGDEWKWLRRHDTDARGSNQATEGRCRREDRPWGRATGPLGRGEWPGAGPPQAIENRRKGSSHEQAPSRSRSREGREEEASRKGSRSKTEAGPGKGAARSPEKKQGMDKQKQKKRAQDTIITGMQREVGDKQEWTTEEKAEQRCRG